MKKIIVILITLFANTFFAKAEDFSAYAYKINDETIDAAFNSSIDITSSAVENLGIVNNLGLKIQKSLPEEDKQMIAGIIAVGSWLLGIGWAIPFHRLYLGTGGETIKIFFLYFCTISGCGVILLVDGILLLLDSKGSKYVDNPKFIMW